MTEDLTFYDDLPGTSTRPGPRQVEERAAQLREHPGRWALWPAKGSVSQIQKQLDRLGEGYEVIARILDNGKGVLARYVGPGGEALPEDDDETLDKVVCPFCDAALVIPAGKTKRGVLDSHYSANVGCRQAARGQRQ